MPVDQTFRNSPLGSAIDLGAAMMNHNCEPNIVIVFNSTQVEVRAVRSIKAGEELQHCYRDIAYDCTFRSPRIESKYQFECHCTFHAFQRSTEETKTLVLTLPQVIDASESLIVTTREQALTSAIPFYTSSPRRETYLPSSKEPKVRPSCSVTPLTSPRS